MNWLEAIGRNVMAALSNVGTAMLLLWQTIKTIKNAQCMACAKATDGSSWRRLTTD